MRVLRNVYSSCLARHCATKAAGSGATSLHASATLPTSTTVPYMSKTIPLMVRLAIRASAGDPRVEVGLELERVGNHGGLLYEG